MEKRVKINLTLEDGTVYSGFSFGAQVPAAGEVVFSTAMTGYPESLTDPSCKGQILCLTFPIVGNCGAPADNDELSSIHVSGLIVSDYSFEFSHWNASGSLDSWLKQNNVPGIYGIDTRALTKRIREKGDMLGKIEPDGCSIEFFDTDKVNLVAEVSIASKKVYGTGKYRIVLVDCGVKHNMIKRLLGYDTTVIRVPWDYDFLKEDYDGLFLSNGPGNPKMCAATIENIKCALSDARPVFGACFGNQLLALASGADIFKLKHGHRSHNQPVLQVGTEKAYITSQNHSFTVDNETIGKEWEPYFININDKTNEGIKHKSLPFFSTQFLPEASGGPTDTDFLLEIFIDNIRKSVKY